MTVQEQRKFIIEKIKYIDKDIYNAKSLSEINYLQCFRQDFKQTFLLLKNN